MTICARSNTRWLFIFCGWQKKKQIKITENHWSHYFYCGFYSHMNFHFIFFSSLLSFFYINAANIIINKIATRKKISKNCSIIRIKLLLLFHAFTNDIIAHFWRYDDFSYRYFGVWLSVNVRCCIYRL